MAGRNQDRFRGARFPDTRHSALRALKEGSGEQKRLALDVITSAYWPAVYKYLRLRWNRDPDAAADLTQSFFLTALEKEYFKDYEPDKARFRTFVRLCLDRYVAKSDRDASRLKRGGDAEHLSLDFGGVESQLSLISSPSDSPEEVFEREWMRTLLSSSIEQLKKEAVDSGKRTQFEVFSEYDLHPADKSERPSYHDLADKHEISIETVTNYLSAMRRSFRRIVLERLREMTASEEEFRAEVHVVLGVDP